MSFRTVAATVLASTLFIAPVSANEPAAASAATPATIAPSTTTNAAVPAPAAAPTLVTHESTVRRPALLPALYASFTFLQAFDGYSTAAALHRGGQEANPMMRGVVSNPALFWSVKTAATITPMLAAERLWKTNKVGAIAVMVAGNGVMAAVAAHNASVLRGMR